MEEYVCSSPPEKREVSSMVFIITGAAESFRNTVARLLAESLGWEFVDAASLVFPAVSTGGDSATH